MLSPDCHLLPSIDQVLLGHVCHLQEEGEVVLAHQGFERLPLYFLGLPHSATPLLLNCGYPLYVAVVRVCLRLDDAIHATQPSVAHRKLLLEGSGVTEQQVGMTARTAIVGTGMAIANLLGPLLVTRVQAAAMKSVT